MLGLRLGCGFKGHSFWGPHGEGEWKKQAKMCMLKRARRMGKSWHLWTSKHAKNNKYINTFSLTHFLFLRLIIKLLWHELLQTSILATDWWEVSKFVTCLWILLILLDLFFIFADCGGWWVGSKNYNKRQ